MTTATKHPVPDRVKTSLVIFYAHWCRMDTAINHPAPDLCHL